MADMPVTATTERRVQTICLFVLTVIATGAALSALKDVMIPFALAMFLSIALAPVVDGLAARTRLSRPVSVALTMLLGVLLLVILGGVVARSISQFDEYYGQLLGDEEGAVADWLAQFRDGKLWGMLSPHLESTFEGLKSLIPGLVAVLGTALSQGITVLIFLMFLLVEQRRSAPRPIAAVLKSASMGETVTARVKQYISVKLFTSAVTGIGVGLTLQLVGAPAPMLFGLLSFLLNFVPTIGSVIAVLLPLPLLLATGASAVTIVLALAIPSAIQFVVGQIWENKLLGDAFDLRASVVLLALVFWGKIWGIVGMLLATPITAVLKTLMEGWELTQPVARAMGQASDVEQADGPGPPKAPELPST